MRGFNPPSHVRRVLAALGLAVTLAVGLAPVVAAATLTYAISGVEYAATDVQAKFAGVAVATDDNGTWLAVVDHSVLSGDPLGATISGGTFSFDGKVRDIAGTFDSGTLTQTGGFTGCSNQTFAVNGALAVTITPGGAASGLFSATLKHYRTLLFGRCITNAATVKGIVAFTLPG